MRFRNALLAAMEEADVASLFTHMSEVALGSGDLLCLPGQIMDRVFFPSSAIISVVISMGDGRDVETASIGFENVAGLFPALTEVPSTTRIFVQIAGSAISLPSVKLRERVAESPPLMKLILRYAQANLAQAEQSAACNALHQLPGRLARWLLISQDRVDSPIMGLTQDYMGVMAGALRSSISLAASGFKRDGLIRYARGHVEIVDREGLERRACACYRIDRANRDGLLPQT